MKHYTVGILMVGMPGAALYENGLPVASMLESAGCLIGSMEPVSEDKQDMEKKLTAWANELHLNLIVIMGSISPEKMRENIEVVCETMLPSVGKKMGVCSAAGICGKTLILNVPGCTETVKKNLKAMLPALDQTLSAMQ